MKAENVVKDVWKLNFFPGPRGKSFFASSALLRSKWYFLNTVKLCINASSESFKVNSGAQGMLQGVLTMFMIKKIKLSGHL
jgi:hypothetical protein